MAASVASCVAAFIHAADTMCGSEILHSVASPDGKNKAVIFQRDCGATTDFSTQVSLLPSSSTLGNEAGNAFIADTNHGAAPSGEGGGPTLGVRWLSPSSIMISHHPSARIFRAPDDVAGIRVRHESTTVLSRPAAAAAGYAADELSRRALLRLTVGFGMAGVVGRLEGRCRSGLVFIACPPPSSHPPNTSAPGSTRITPMRRSSSLFSTRSARGHPA